MEGSPRHGIYGRVRLPAKAIERSTLRFFLRLLRGDGEPECCPWQIIPHLCRQTKGGAGVDELLRAAQGSGATVILDASA